MAQPPTPSNNVMVNMKNMIFATIGVLFVAALIYFVYDQLGGNYAWSLLFLILLNVYLVYRVSIRNKIGEKLFDDRDFVDPNTRPGQRVDNDFDEKSGNELFEMYDDEYPTCSNCGSKIIPDMKYCESCGKEFTND